jgi:hypothetical protein
METEEQKQARRNARFDTMVSIMNSFDCGVSKSSLHDLVDNTYQMFLEMQVDKREDI